MTESRLFDPQSPPEWLDSVWWTDTANCNHLDNRVHRARLEAAASEAMSNARTQRTDCIVDLGAGDGGMLSLLEQPFRFFSFGYEIIDDSVRYANEVRGVRVRKANVLTDDLELSKVIVATEMLEHLADPHAFVKKLYDDGRANVFIASSPHSETAEHHEWNHAWAWDHDGYRELITGGGWKVARHFDAEWSQVLVGVR